MRTDARMRQQAREAFRSNRESVARCERSKHCWTSPLNWTYQHVYYSEYMHSICLGVVKRLLTLWVSVPGPWNIFRKTRGMDARMKSICPPHKIFRLPRKVSKYKYWKAVSLEIGCFSIHCHVFLEFLVMSICSTGPCLYFPLT